MKTFQTVCTLAALSIFSMGAQAADHQGGHENKMDTKMQDMKGNMESDMQSMKNKHGEKNSMMQKFDANKDGQLSKAEFTEYSMAKFKDMDKDGDSMVSQEEYKAAHHAMKGKGHNAKEGKAY